MDKETAQLIDEAKQAARVAWCERTREYSDNLLRRLAAELDRVARWAKGDLYVNKKRVATHFHISVRMFTVEQVDYLDTITMLHDNQVKYVLRPIVDRNGYVKLREIEHRIDPE